MGPIKLGAAALWRPLAGRRGNCSPRRVSPCRKDSVGMKKAAVHEPSRVMNFRNQKLQEDTVQSEEMALVLLLLLLLLLLLISPTIIIKQQQ